MSNIKTQIGKIIGESLNGYYGKVKPTIDDLKFRQEYQDRIINCMIGEVDDNYIKTPETDAPVVKLEHSKEGVVKVSSIKGKTILVDLDGNETDTPSEGCRLVSVGEDENNKLIILSKNKNLFNGIYTLDKWDNKVTEYIYVKGTNSITHSTISIGDGQLISTSRFYDKDKNLIKENGNNWNNRSIDVPNGAEYVQYSVKPSVDIKTFMIEVGTVATSYIPHQSHKTEILLNEPLRSLSNEIYDEIVGNKIIRRVGSVLVNGSKDFGIQSLDANNQVLSDYSVDPKSKYLGTQKGIMKYPFGLSNRCTRVLKLTMDRIEGYEPITHTQAIEMFKKHFTENPTEVLYELEEPIIEELPNSITLQGFDDTTMYIENSITPTVSYGYNALIPYKQELSNQKEEVGTNILDIDNNIIPYLMDIEFNLMLMEDN